MGAIDISKPSVHFLSSIDKKSWQHQIIWECWESNQGLLGVKRVRYRLWRPRSQFTSGNFYQYQVTFQVRPNLNEINSLSAPTSNLPPESNSSSSSSSVRAHLSLPTPTPTPTTTSTSSTLEEKKSSPMLTNPKIKQESPKSIEDQLIEVKIWDFFGWWLKICFFAALATR